MIIVLGSVRVTDEAVTDALELSLAHVRRSRTEQGCLSHHVSIDGEDGCRLNFHETWADLASLQLHFKVPESVAFVSQLKKMTIEPPKMTLYEATELS